MTNRELRNALLVALSSELIPYGFVLNKSQAEFTRRAADGWHKFQLIFLMRSNGWEINLGLLIRKNLVESIYHQASYFEPKYHKTTPTVGLSVETLINDGQEHRFQLRTISDLTPCFEGILNLFNQVAIPFFAKYNSIEALDREVNVENRSSIFSWINQGSIGVILAKLVGNPKYVSLKKKYHSHYKKLSDGFYLPEYEGVVNALESRPMSIDDISNPTTD